MNLARNNTKSFEMTSNSEHSSSGEEEYDEETDFDLEVEDFEVNQVGGATALVHRLESAHIGPEDYEDDDEPYSGEPLADQEWLDSYYSLH